MSIVSVRYKLILHDIEHLRVATIKPWENSMQYHMYCEAHLETSEARISRKDDKVSFVDIHVVAI